MNAPDLDRVKIPPRSPGNDNGITGNIILDRDIFGDGDQGDFGISMTYGQLAVGVHNGTSGIGLCGTQVVADGSWHHIAITRPLSDG